MSADDSFSHLSFGSLECTLSSGQFATRVKAISKDQVVLASKTQIFCLQLTSSLTTYRPQTKAKGVSVPVPLSALKTAKIATHHPCDIQSIANVGTLIASIDAQGNLLIRDTENIFDQLSSEPKEKKKPNSTFFWKNPDHSTFSWAGVCFHPTNPNIVATCHSDSRKIRVFKDSEILREYNVSDPPTSITLLENGFLAVSSKSLVSLWDINKAAKAAVQVEACISMIRMARPVNENEVSFAGDYGATMTLNTKTKGIMSRWAAASKYEITGFCFSADRNLCYTSGLDNEIMCNPFALKTKIPRKKKKWGASAGLTSKLQLNHQLGFRGDSRWVGVSIFSEEGRDFIFGISELGTVYYCEDAQKMIGTLIEESNMEIEEVETKTS